MGLGHINNNLIHIGPALPNSNPISIFESHSIDARPFQSISRRFGPTQHQFSRFEAVWIDSSLFGILGFHSRHFPFDSINFQPFQIDWNTGVSFIKGLSRFDHVLSHFASIRLFWVVLWWIQCVLFHSEPNCIHSVCFWVVDLLSSYYRLMGANSYWFEIPDAWAKV